jgi:hypothetical protein
MNVLTLPRYVATLEYKALRLPATVLQSQVATLLSEDSKVRLTVEKTLGAIDEKVGGLLADDNLTNQGRLLRRRSEILGKAVQLEEVADQRKAAAEAALREGTKKAERARQKATDDQRQAVQAALREEQAAKQRVEDAARARVAAEKKRVEERADARAQDVTAQLEAQEDRIDAVEEARTSAPKAQLTGALEQKQKAETERAKAKRLADLAAAEAKSRKAQ